MIKGYAGILFDWAATNNDKKHIDDKEKSFFMCKSLKWQFTPMLIMIVIFRKMSKSIYIKSVSVPFLVELQR